MLVILLAGNMTSQIEGVNYDLSYNNSPPLFDCYFFIEKGEYKCNLQKIKFNSQLSIIDRLEPAIEVSKIFIPVVDNENEINRQPLDWIIKGVAIAPYKNELNSYSALSPCINQTAFFNIMEAGGKMKLFSVKATSKEGEIIEIIRYGNRVGNLIDVKDLSNSFSLGSTNQLYKGIDEIENDDTRIYVQ